MRNILRPLLLILSALCLTACGGGGDGSSNGGNNNPPPVPTGFTYTIPPDIGDGWQTSSLVDQGFDTARIVAMMDQIINEDYEGIDSIAIVRNERLVLYWFAQREFTQFDNWIQNTDRQRHILHSTTKSFTSALAGIAIDQGYIASADVPFYDLFNHASYENWDPRKATMTLQDALTMQFGYQWDEWSLPYSDPNNQLANLNTNNTDWAKALLDLPLANDPGTMFTYNTAGTNAIGQAVQNAVGMPLDEFANQNLFLPMQITTADWAKTPTNLPIGGSGLFLRTRDLAKFGQLYLNNGEWQGQQIISPEWIAASVTPFADVSNVVTFSENYGYQWWLDELGYRGQPVETWVTSGYGGQYSFVVPSLDLVVVFTGHNYDSFEGIRNLYTMMNSTILDSID